MTRLEFLDNVTCFSELIEFCDEIRCDLCEDVICYDDLYDNVLDDIRDDAPDCLSDLQSYIGDISTNYDWYCRGGWLDYRGLTDEDFEEYKQDVLDYAEEYGDFDEEDEDDCGEYEDEEEAPAEPEAVFEQDPNFGSCPDRQYNKLFEAAGSAFVVMVDERIKEQRAKDEAFRSAAAGAIQIITQ